MEIRDGESGVLACLTLDESQSEAALAEASRLSEESGARLTVVQLYPGRWNGPLKGHRAAWHLKSDDPVPALLRFAERNRITRIVA